MVIPQHVVQTSGSRHLAEDIQEARCGMISANQGWRFDLFDDRDALDFVSSHYEPAILRAYLSIDEAYGAARADLFRYLYIYANGGIYLDIKSRFTSSISDHVRPDDSFILSQWRNGADDPFPGFGLHQDLGGIARGEFQQWHIIAAKNHPFLEAVISRVVRNIETYNVWKHGAGRIGVQRVTGPIAYTLAIDPLRKSTPHRMVASEADAGLQYSVVSHSAARHYSSVKKPVVRTGVVNRLSAPLYFFIKNMRGSRG